VDRLPLSLAASPLVFAACALAARPPGRRIVAALTGGAAFAAGDVGWDFLARAAGWWSYPGFGAHGPLLGYAAAAFSLMALALGVQLALGGDPGRLR
jgi:hypothetical protein